MFNTSSSSCLSDFSDEGDYRNYRNTAKSRFIRHGSAIPWKSLRYPLVYHTHVQHTQPKHIEKKKQNFFVKAFQWYTQEHHPRINRNKENSRDPHLADFAKWLDDKYDKFLQEQETNKRSPPVEAQTQHAEGQTRASNTYVKGRGSSCNCRTILEPQTLLSESESNYHYNFRPMKHESSTTKVQKENVGPESKSLAPTKNHGEKPCCNLECIKLADKKDATSGRTAKNTRNLRKDTVACQCENKYVVMKDAQEQYGEQDWAVQTPLGHTYICQYSFGANPLPKLFKKRHKNKKDGSTDSENTGASSHNDRHTCNCCDGCTHLRDVSMQYENQDASVASNIQKEPNVHVNMAEKVTTNANANGNFPASESYRSLNVTYAFLNEETGSIQKSTQHRSQPPVESTNIMLPKQASATSLKILPSKKMIKKSDDKGPYLMKTEGAVRYSVLTNTTAQTSIQDIQLDQVQGYPLFMKIVCADKLKE